MLVVCSRPCIRQVQCTLADHGRHFCSGSRLLPLLPGEAETAFCDLHRAGLQSQAYKARFTSRGAI